MVNRHSRSCDLGLLITEKNFPSIPIYTTSDTRPASFSAVYHLLWQERTFQGPRTAEGFMI